jgi:hypothetical protein
VDDGCWVTEATDCCVYYCPARLRKPLRISPFELSPKRADNLTTLEGYISSSKATVRFDSYDISLHMEAVHFPFMVV